MNWAPAILIYSKSGITPFFGGKYGMIANNWLRKHPRQADSADRS